MICFHYQREKIVIKRKYIVELKVAIICKELYKTTNGETYTWTKMTVNL